MSSACFSGSASSFSVIGPPAIRSTLIICVLPTRAHSVSIWRTVTSCASIDTSPSWIDNVSPPAQEGDAEAISRHSVKSSLFIRFEVNPNYKSGTLDAEVFDDFRDDFVELHFWLVTDQFADFGQVRHPPRHILEPRLI